MANEDQAKFWTEQGGPLWLAREEQLDESSRPFGRAALDAAVASPGETVLDVGCGTGPTTLLLAKSVGDTGKVVGLDISPLLLGRAKEKAEEAGLSNVEFVHADAQTAPLEPVNDLVFSRMGVMFFEDAVAAFKNLHSSLKNDGRLTFACWQDVFKNQWMSLPTMAAASVLGSFDLPPEGSPGPFYYADPDRAREVLTEAGFRDIDIQSFEATMNSTEANVVDRLGLALSMGPLGEKFREADEATRQKTVDAVIDAAKPFFVGDEYRLPGAAWIVTAKA